MATTVKIFMMIFAIFCSSVAISAAAAGDPVGIDFYVVRQMSVVSEDETSRERNAQVMYKVEKGGTDPSEGYEIIVSGDGDYDRYTQVSWETVSRVDVHEGLIRPRRSVRKIYDNGKLIATIVHEYRYDEGIVFFKRTDAEGAVVESEGYTLKGPTCDDTNLAQFIRGIYVDGVPDEYQKFYLLSNEPTLYRVKTRVVGQEALDLPGGAVEAVKLQLMPDMGILTRLVAKIVGPTYIWLEAEYPHRWLQYEGRESGRDSDIVKTYIADYWDSKH